MSTFAHIVALACALLLAPAWRGVAQTAEPTAPVPEDAPDELFADDVADADASAIIDELEEYRRRPIDLRTATVDALARLPGITGRAAETILRFVDSAGPAVVGELDSIPDLTAEQLLTLRAYTTLRRPGSKPPAGRVTIDVRTRLVSDLQPRRGYRDRLQRVRSDPAPDPGDSTGLDTVDVGSSYLGGRLGILTRARIAWAEYSMGVTFEKDRGEPLVWDDTLDYAYSRYELVDSARWHGRIRRRLGAFVSAHARAELPPVTIYLGDYSAAFGQGLILGAPSIARGADPAGAPFGSQRGLAAYASPGEAQFFRGAAATLRDGAWLPRGFTADAFVSARTFHAALEEAAGGARPASIADDGYRRTRAEIRSSGNVEERLAGVHIRHGFRGGAIGLTAYGAFYGTAADDDGPRTFGAGVTLASLDCRYGSWWGTVFGEIARGADGSIGAVGGAMTAIGGTEIVLAGRWLPAGFDALHSGITDAGGNERGIYLGARARPASGLDLGAALDLFSAPDRTRTLSFPPLGADGYLQIRYAPTDGLSLSARLRGRSARDGIAITDSLGRERSRIVERRSTNGRVEAACGSDGGALQLRARFERRFVEYEAGAPARNGTLALVDLRIAPSATLTIGARFAIFTTDGFDAAIYELESDLPGRMTSVGLYGDGRRLYLYARWHPLGAIGIAAAYSETVYPDGTVISPGSLQEIDGPVNNALAVQLDLRF